MTNIFFLNLRSPKSPNLSDKYGPLSFSYNKKKSSPSPGSAKRISLTSGMVRFGNDDEDDQNADDSSSSSSQEDGEEPGHWSGDEAGGGPKQDLRDNMSSSIRRKRYIQCFTFSLSLHLFPLYG